MALTEADLPEDWTANYGAFVGIGDDLVLATCRRCFATVNSDSFKAHTDHCTQMSLRSML